MSRDERQTWKHDMSSLLDLSAWKRDGDIGKESNDTKVEHLEEESRIRYSPLYNVAVFQYLCDD